MGCQENIGFCCSTFKNSLSSCLHFCCFGARLQIIEMNSSPHSNFPEVGTRIVAVGFGLLLLLVFPKCHIIALSWLSLSIFSLAPGTELSAFLSATLICYFPVSFFLAGSTFSMFLMLGRGKKKVGKS